jgi:hypothetical protein
MAVKTVDFDPKLFSSDAYGNLHHKQTIKQKVDLVKLHSPVVGTPLTLYRIIN